MSERSSFCRLASRECLIAAVGVLGVACVTFDGVPGSVIQWVRLASAAASVVAIVHGCSMAGYWIGGATMSEIRDEIDRKKRLIEEKRYM